MIVLGLLKILLIIIVAVIVMPPVGQAVHQTLLQIRSTLPLLPPLLAVRLVAIFVMQVHIVYSIKALLALKILMKLLKLRPRALL